MLLISVFITLWITCCAFPSNKEFHNYMDNEELKFYFGSEKTLPDYEIVDLPENLWNGRESVVNDDGKVDKEKYLNFKVFNKNIKLNLHPNRHLISPAAKVMIKSKNATLKIANDISNESCHYLHSNAEFSAAISNCASKEIHGLIFTKDDTLEIVPLTARLKFIATLRTSGGVKTGMSSNLVPHLIKRSQLDFGNFENDFRESSFGGIKLAVNKNVNVQPMVELGIFFDEAFYKFFAPFYNHDMQKLRNFVLSYINGVQSLYHHHSLTRKVDLTIVYLEFMETQSPLMPHAYGERNTLLDNFCHYQKTLNPIQDESPDHWDMALYVSGLDFFHWDTNGNKNGVTMGLATVGGVCNDAYNCVIAEFGSINQFGRPYPSSGFTSVYILAHEIGHNLGMSHDSTGNSCSKEGFIMSPSRGTQGETTWSSCSAGVAKMLNWAKCLFDQPLIQPILDHSVHSNYPGVSITAKQQCEILLRDRDAFVFVNGDQSSICDNLHCRTPNKSGFFFAGPALHGTSCGNSKWCEGGSCVNKHAISTTTMKTAASWGPWKSFSCRSGCIKYGKGAQMKERFCSESNECEGPSTSVGLCDDRRICPTRKTITDYGTQKCKDFSLKIPLIDPNGSGLQAPYENLRLWVSCAIFCKRKNTASYYAPRVELNAIGMSGYYPDGTFCHREGKENYYCMQHHCLPEGTKLSKVSKSIKNSTSIEEWENFEP